VKSFGKIKMPEGERSQREEGGSSRKGLETRLQAEDDGGPWNIHRQLQEQLQQRKTAKNLSAVSEMDEANPTNTPNPLPVGENTEDSDLDDVGEGVWGYLLPLNSQYSTRIALKNGNARPIAKTENPYEIRDLQHAERNPVSIAGRYLIGRHPECGE
jgi:hypothetical protein